MKKLSYFIVASAAFVLLVAANRSTDNTDSFYGLKRGTASVKSVSAIAFGPDGILFIGDSRSATVFCY